MAIEAMRAGTAVIASDRGSLPELVEDGVSGYIFHLDENDLGNLEQILRGLDKNRLREMGAAAARRFEKGFTSEAMNRGLLDVYTELHQKASNGGAAARVARQLVMSTQPRRAAPFRNHGHPRAD